MGFDRPVVFVPALLRLSLHGGVAGDPGPRGKTQTGAAPDGNHQQPNTSKAAAARKVPVSPWWDHDRAGQSGVVFGRHPRLKPALSELKAEDLSRYNRLYNRHMTAEGNQFVALEISKIVTKR
jgi:hypothetical protein